MKFLNKQENEIIDFYKKNGFVVIKDIFKTKYLENIKKRILLNANKEQNHFYYENIGKKRKLRRIEKVIDFSNDLKKIVCSKRILNIINKVENNKSTLFKDKLNFKYPGGKGYHPHIDGHFLWRDKKNKLQKGWKKYSNNFTNLVLPLEDTNKKNGCVFLSKKENTKKLGKNFNEISKNLEIGTPNIKKKDLIKFAFIPIELNVGDICLFNWKCAHFSKKNYSIKSRMIAYITYCNKNKITNVRNKYYIDKLTSKNDKNNKSLLFN